MSEDLFNGLSERERDYILIIAQKLKELNERETREIKGIDPAQQAQKAQDIQNLINQINEANYNSAVLSRQKYAPGSQNQYESYFDKKQCTFKPQINKNSSRLAKRSNQNLETTLNKLYQDAIERQNKIEQIKTRQN